MTRMHAAVPYIMIIDAGADPIAVLLDDVAHMDDRQVLQLAFDRLKDSKHQDESWLQEITTPDELYDLIAFQGYPSVHERN